MDLAYLKSAELQTLSRLTRISQKSSTVYTKRLACWASLIEMNNLLKQRKRDQMIEYGYEVKTKNDNEPQ